MTTYNVSSGVTSSGITVATGDVLNVLSGGTATTIVVDGGRIFVEGTENDTALNAGGREYVSSGGTASGTTVNSGAIEFVYVGGTASGTTVDNGGFEIVSSGGITAGTTVNNGGTEVLSAGVKANTTTVNNGGTEIVSSGATVSGSIVNNGGTEIAYVGGDTQHVTVNAGGDVVVAGGVASGVTVNNGGIEIVSAGGTTSNATVNNGGIEYVYSGSLAIGTTVNSGGQESVSSGGVASSLTVRAGGTAAVYSGGLMSNITVVGSGATDFVYNGAETINTTLSSGGIQYVSSGGTASATVVNSGATEILTSSGTTIGSIVNGDGLEIVSSGGTARLGQINNGGIVSLLSGGTSISMTVNNGGALNVSSAGTAITTTVGNGGVETLYDGGVSSDVTVTRGSEIVSSGGTASSTIVDNGGIVTVDTNGTTVGAKINSGGTEYAYSGGVTSGTSVSSGGTEFVYSGGTASGTTISAGGTLNIQNGGTATGGIVFSGANAALIVGGGLLPTTTIDGFAPTDTIDLTSISYNSTGSATLDPTSDILTVTEGGTSHTLQLAGSYTGDFFHLAADSGGGTVITEDTTPPCFCAGTHILTPNGNVLVERLRVGDLVSTLSETARLPVARKQDGQLLDGVGSGATRPIKWIGRRQVTVTDHADPELVRPIRIVAHALAADVPSHDLLLSPDHAVFIDGKLIPARLLRNGATIHEEHGCQSVTYFHIELETHDLLLADGMPAESYLDTGNRANFENTGMPMILHPNFSNTSHQARREAGSCAPLVSDVLSVLPIWQAIAQRSKMLGFNLLSTKTTKDPALYIAAGGRRFMPVYQDETKFTFFLPKLLSETRLISRSTKPSALQPWVEDRREMGVMVRQLVFQSQNDYVVVPADDPRLAEGWWAIEGDTAGTWRWTNGNALLPVTGCPMVVEVVIGDTQAYPLADHNEQDAILAPTELCA